MIFYQLADRAHAAVAQVVDVVRGALAVVDVEDAPHDRDEVLAPQRAVLWRLDQAEPLVQLVAPDLAEVVAAVGEEQRLEQRVGVVRGRRVAGAQTAVDFDNRSVRRAELVLGERPSVPRKPDPSSALEIARRLAIEPADFLYLGDTATDMKTANGAGMFAVGVLWGFRDAEELIASGAAKLISTPAQLLELL